MQSVALWIHMNKQSLLLAVLCLLLMKRIWYHVLDLVMVSLSLFMASLHVHHCTTVFLDWLLISYFLLVASTHDKDAFSFYPDNRPCNGLEEALTRYREIVPHLKLSGSTQPSFLAYFKARFSYLFCCPFDAFDWTWYPFLSKIKINPS